MVNELYHFPLNFTDLETQPFQCRCGDIPAKIRGVIFNFNAFGFGRPKRNAE